MYKFTSKDLLYYLKTVCAQYTRRRVQEQTWVAELRERIHALIRNTNCSMITIEFPSHPSKACIFDYLVSPQEGQINIRRHIFNRWFKNKSLIVLLKYVWKRIMMFPWERCIIQEVIYVKIYEIRELVHELRPALYIQERVSSIFTYSYIMGNWNSREKSQTKNDPFI